MGSFVYYNDAEYMKYDYFLYNSHKWKKGLNIYNRNLRFCQNSI